MIFKEFVEDNLPKHRPRTPIVFVPKHNSLETANSYFLLPATLDRIENHDVVLLLSSVSTSERLRNIVSLLASQGVASITVVCLFNRMGPNTSSFISRIKRLLRGVGRDHGNSKKRHTGFDFHFLYSLPDLSSDDLAEMQQTMEALFTYYAGQTRVASFRRWMSQDHKYFRPHSVTSSDFERPIKHANHLTERFKLAIENGSAGDASPPIEIEVGTQEGKLALLCSRLVAQRDYEPVIRELTRLSDKETLYKLFGILLADLSYLKMTGRFAVLRAALIAEVRKLRAVRFAHEDLARELGGLCVLSLIEATVDIETYLLFGLSLFSFLDHEFDYEFFIRETLTCGLDLSLSGWSRRPVNFSLYLGEERIMWCLSMLLHFSQHNFRHPEVGKDLKERLKTEVDGLLRDLDQVLPGDEHKESRQKVKANLNLLLTELGFHDLKAKHQVIRYLQSKIIAVRRGHNPIYSNLETALRALRSVVDFAPPAESGEDGNRRVRVTETKTKKTLEDAIYTVGILEEISDAVRQLLLFTPTRKTQAQRFAREPGLPGFAEDVNRLGDIFQKIREFNLISKRDVDEILALRNRLVFDLWDDNSYLRRLLLDYALPLHEWTEAAMISANQTLETLGFGDVWSMEIKKLQEWDVRWLVLMDRHVLREVLRNVFTNVRHTFTGRRRVRGYGRSVSVGIERIKAPAPDLKNEMRDYFQLTVSVKGQTLPSIPQDTTLETHQQEVENFGGSLTIQQGSVVLTLLARQLPKPDFPGLEEEKP